MICAGNWKMFKGPQETRSYFEEFLGLISPEQSSNFVFFVPAINLLVAKEFLSTGKVKIGWGAQNCYFTSEGAFTGENSPQVLAQVGATHCLVGHSERRQIFGETDSWCAQKVAVIQEAGMIPVLCLGETAQERERHQTESVIVRQLKQGLAEVKDKNKHKPLWIAYEPVWAIGTGKVATPEQAGEAHSILRHTLEDLWGKNRASEIPLLYGGSVKPENSRSLALQKNVDGFLVGGASLQPQTFCQIYENALS